VNTTQIKKRQSAGINAYLLKAKNMPLTNKVLFRDDEKLVFTRRLMIMYLLLQGFSYIAIEKKIGCSRNTISQVKKQLAAKKVNSQDLHKELKGLFK
jgi:DNA-binding NarL/FixJ family response regulator